MVMINKEKKWRLTVIREDVSTIIDMMSDASDEEWSQQLRVTFVGEAGVDSGGLQRELFSLLFTSPHFHAGGFSTSAKALAKREYFLLGKAAAYAILAGHPGPRNLSKTVLDYILTGKEPPHLDTACNDGRLKAIIDVVSITTVYVNTATCLISIKVYSEYFMPIIYNYPPALLKLQNEEDDDVKWDAIEDEVNSLLESAGFQVGPI